MADKRVPGWVNAWLWLLTVGVIAALALAFLMLFGVLDRDYNVRLVDGNGKEVPDQTSTPCRRYDEPGGVTPPAAEVGKGCIEDSGAFRVLVVATLTCPDGRAVVLTEGGWGVVGEAWHTDADPYRDAC